MMPQHHGTVNSTEPASPRRCGPAVGLRRLLVVGACEVVDGARVRCVELEQIAPGCGHNGRGEWVNPAPGTEDELESAADPARDLGLHEVGEGRDAGGVDALRVVPDDDATVLEV